MDTLRGVDRLKRYASSVRFISTHFHAESSVMRQKTKVSVVGNDIKNVVFVSENEGSDLGMPWPDGPPSSDCPVGWHADDAPRRHRGSRPVLAQNQGVRVPIPAGAFYAPKNKPQGFYIAKNCVFEA